MTVLDTFPRVPHLPGSRAADDDVHLDDIGTRGLLARNVIVTEKLDGLRAELLRGKGARIEARLKRSYRGALRGDVERALSIWVLQREEMLAPLLQRGGAIYGEWMLHRLHVAYDALPDAFIAFALRTHDGAFVENERALALLARAGVTTAQPIFRGVLGSMRRVRDLAERASSFATSSRREGVVIAACGEDPSVCAKWVAPHYRHVARSALSGARNLLRS